MRTAFIDYNPIDVGGGAEAWLADVCPRLKPISESVVITLNRGRRQAQIKAGLVQSGTAVKEFHALHPSSAISPFDQISFSKAISNADVVYFIFSPGGLELTTLFAHWMSDVPVIAGHHQPLERPWGEVSFPRSWEAYFRVFGFRSSKVAMRFRVHHVLNRETESLLSRIPNLRLYRIPHGVDLSRFGLRDKFETFTILFLGRLHRQKGADRLDRIFNTVRRILPSTRLIIAGAGQLGSEFDSLRKTPGVEILGFVTDDVKRELLSRAHVLVMPSRYETFGIVGLEALASGTPVVATNIPGPREYVLVGANGFLVDNLDGFADAILRVHDLWTAQDSTLFAQAVRESAREFDWERVIPKLGTMLLETSREPH